MFFPIRLHGCLVSVNRLTESYMKQNKQSLLMLLSMTTSINGCLTAKLPETARNLNVGEICGH